MVAARGGAACLEGIVHIVQVTNGTVGGLIAPVIDNIICEMINGNGIFKEYEDYFISF